MILICAPSSGERDKHRVSTLWDFKRCASLLVGVE
nr:MAG TPA: hypothetical protein [Caudoviricetes sp.]